MDELKKIVDELYDKVWLSTVKLLTLCKFLSLEGLKEEDDPSIQDVSDWMNEASAIIQTITEMLSHDLEYHHKASKAYDFSLIVKHISAAIIEGDEETLKKLTEELDKGSFL